VNPNVIPKHFLNRRKSYAFFERNGPFECKKNIFVPFMICSTFPKQTERKGNKTIGLKINTVLASQISVQLSFYYFSHYHTNYLTSCFGSPCIR
jgi:hypothetical protein